MTARKKTNQHDPEDRLDRCRRMYRRQQDGLTCRALVYEHMQQESVCESTAWRDWAQVRSWNDEDFSKERESMVSRLASLRFKAIERAMKKGQLMVAANLMDSLGRAVGEGTEFTQAEEVKLSINIEPPAEN